MINTSEQTLLPSPISHSVRGEGGAVKGKSIQSEASMLVPNEEGAPRFPMPVELFPRKKRVTKDTRLQDISNTPKGRVRPAKAKSPKPKVPGKQVVLKKPKEKPRPGIDKIVMNSLRKEKEKKRQEAKEGQAQRELREREKLELKHQNNQIRKLNSIKFKRPKTMCETRDDKKAASVGKGKTEKNKKNRSCSYEKKARRPKKDDIHEFIRNKKKQTRRAQEQLALQQAAEEAKRMESLRQVETQQRQNLAKKPKKPKKQQIRPSGLAQWAEESAHDPSQDFLEEYAKRKELEQIQLVYDEHVAVDLRIHEMFTEPVSIEKYAAKIQGLVRGFLTRRRMQKVQATARQKEEFQDLLKDQLVRRDLQLKNLQVLKHQDLDDIRSQFKELPQGVEDALMQIIDRRYQHLGAVLEENVEEVEKVLTKELDDQELEKLEEELGNRRKNLIGKSYEDEENTRLAEELSDSGGRHEFLEKVDLRSLNFSIDEGDEQEYVEDLQPEFEDIEEEFEGIEREMREMQPGLIKTYDGELDLDPQGLQSSPSQQNWDEFSPGEGTLEIIGHVDEQLFNKSGEEDSENSQEHSSLSPDSDDSYSCSQKIAENFALSQKSEENFEFSEKLESKKIEFVYDNSEMNCDRKDLGQSSDDYDEKLRTFDEKIESIFEKIENSDEKRELTHGEVQKASDEKLEELERKIDAKIEKRLNRSKNELVDRNLDGIISFKTDVQDENAKVKIDKNFDENIFRDVKSDEELDVKMGQIDLTADEKLIENFDLNLEEKTDIKTNEKTPSLNLPLRSYNKAEDISIDNGTPLNEEYSKNLSEIEDLDDKFENIYEISDDMHDELPAIPSVENSIPPDQFSVMTELILQDLISESLKQPVLPRIEIPMRGDVGEEERQIRTDTASVLAYVEEIFIAADSMHEDIQKNLRQPLVRNPLEMLSKMQETQIGTFVEPAIREFPLIIGVEIYLNLEKPREEQSCMGSLSPNTLQIVSEAEHIHNKLIFDATNEALQTFRPYGTKGTPYPWSNDTLHTAPSVTSIHQCAKIVTKEIEKWSSVQAGQIAKDEPVFSNLDSEEDGLQNTREDRLANMLADEVINSDAVWVDYEFEEAQTKIDVADMILEDLVGELVRAIK